MLFLNLFSKTGLEVCEGQQHDMNFETQEHVSVEEYIHMITYKTAVLLGCSLQMGAICANASEENQKNLYETVFGTTFINNFNRNNLINLILFKIFL